MKILVFVLLLAVSSESVSGIWANNEVSVILLEKEEKNSSNESEKGKKESTEKIFHEFSILQQANNSRSLMDLNHIHFKYSAYLSLPEIPPDLS